MRIVIFLFFLFTYSIINAQIGGEKVFNFLDIPVSARQGALGGSVIAIKDDDPNLSIDNPSLLTAEMHSSLTFTYLNYFSDINYGYFSYINDFKKYGTFSAGIKYIDYGKFLETDEGGNELGNFSAAEYAFILGWGKNIDSSFSVGANLKPIYSRLYFNSSVAIALDVVATYHNSSKNFTTSLLIKNIGRQLTTYTEDAKREALPFQIQAGISKKLAHTPIRLNVDFIHLQNWNLAYNDSTIATNQNNDLTQEEKNERNKTGITSEFFRHIVAGVEFLPSKSFMIRFGYNFKRRSELAFDNRGKLVGFSWGVGFRIKKFHISYGSASYHLAGSSNHFTITTNISDYYKKNQVITEKPKRERKVRNKKTSTE